MKTSKYYVYIMTNKNNTAFYTGVTNSIARRYIEHKEKMNKNSFTSQYNISKLLYIEKYDNVEDAIKREKQTKGGSRLRKIDLIDSINPEWNDLFREDLSEPE